MLDYPALFAVAQQGFINESWHFLTALFPLLKVIFTSGWGWFYIIMTLIIATALGKKNLIWLVASIITYIGLMTGWQANLVPIAGKWITSGPVPALTGFFQLSPMTVNMGTKAMILGAWFCFGLIPLMLNMRQVVLQTNGVAANPEDELDMNDPVVGLRVLAASVLFCFTPLFFVICLWKALFALHYGVDVTPLFGIANITLPHWKPIWQMNYFVPALLTAGIGFVTTILSNHFFALPVRIPAGCLTVVLGFFLCLASMLVPVGLTLAALGASILWIIWIAFELVITS